MKTIKLSPTQEMLLNEVLLEEIERISRSNMQYKGQLIASLKAIQKQVEPPKE